MIRSFEERFNEAIVKFGNISNYNSSSARARMQIPSMSSFAKKVAIKMTREGFVVNGLKSNPGVLPTQLQLVFVVELMISSMTDEEIANDPDLVFIKKKDSEVFDRLKSGEIIYRKLSKDHPVRQRLTIMAASALNYVKKNKNEIMSREF